MSRTLQFKRQSAAAIANTTGANGELIIDSTNHTITVHDGVNAGGSRLATEGFAQQNPGANAIFFQSNAALSLALTAYGQALTSTILAAYAFRQANSAFDKANTASGNGISSLSNTGNTGSSTQTYTTLLDTQGVLHIPQSNTYYAHIRGDTPNGLQLEGAEVVITANNPGTSYTTSNSWYFNTDGSTTFPGNLQLNKLYLNSLNVGTLSFYASGLFGTFSANANTYQQVILQNSNTGTQASADYVVSNYYSTDGFLYGDFGINGPNFVGSGSLNTANNVYLYANNTDLAIGTASQNVLHFVVNGGATDAMNISSSGVNIGQVSIDNNGNIKANTIDFGGASLSTSHWGGQGLVSEANSAAGIGYNLMNISNEYNGNLGDIYIQANGNTVFAAIDTNDGTTQHTFNFGSDGSLTIPNKIIFADNSTFNGNTLITGLLDLQSTSNTLIQTSAAGGAKTWNFTSYAEQIWPDNTVQTTAFSNTYISQILSNANTANTPSATSNAAFVKANAAFTQANSAFAAANAAATIIPQNAQASNYVLANTDAGKHLYYTNGSPVNLYIPWTSNTTYAIGTSITIISHTSSNVTVTPNVGVNMYLAGNTTSASRNVTTYGMATLIMTAANTWYINGSGVV